MRKTYFCKSNGDSWTIECYFETEQAKMTFEKILLKSDIEFTVEDAINWLN